MGKFCKIDLKSSFGFNWQVYRKLTYIIKWNSDVTKMYFFRKFKVLLIEKYHIAKVIKHLKINFENSSVCHNFIQTLEFEMKVNILFPVNKIKNFF